MFINMSALIFTLSFNLIWRIGSFFRSSVTNSFFPLSRRSLKFPFFHYVLFRHDTFDIDDLGSMQDDPLCIHCMSWLINEKSKAIGWTSDRKSDGLERKVNVFLPPTRVRDEWIRSIFLSLVCLMFQIISICIFRYL